MKVREGDFSHSNLWDIKKIACPINNIQGKMDSKPRASGRKKLVTFEEQKRHECGQEAVS